MLANLQELENSGDFEKGGLESQKSQNKRNQKKFSAVLYRSDDWLGHNDITTYFNVTVFMVC